jgi:RND family efflux transporter MFP subunit
MCLWRKICSGYRTFALFSALSLAFAVSSCGGDGPPGSRKGNGEKAQAPRAVRLAAAEQGLLPRTVAVTGTLAADVDVVAGFKVAGRVTEIPVDLGTPVRKGQVLARLDPTDYRLRVQQAEAALRQVRAGLGLSPEGTEDRVDPDETALVREAEAVLQEARQNRERMEQLWKKEYIARAEYDASLAKLLVAEGKYQAAVEEIRNRVEVLAERRSGLELAKQQLADTILRSPIDGAVRERKAQVGEYLAAGAPVVGLVKIHPLRLKVAVPERDAPAVRTGQVVIVRIEGDPVEHKGRVVRLSPAIQEQNRTMAVEAEVANPGGRLRPGAFARADIVVQAALPAVLAPASAVVTFAGIEKVFLAKDGRAVERKIRTGRRSGDLVEVLEGLTAGERVVVGPGNLVGGMPVTVTR